MFEARSFVAGKWLTSQEAIKLRNPWNGKVVSRSHMATPDQVDLAVDAAREAFAGFSRWPAHRRAAVLRGAAERMEHRKEEIARVIMAENAKSLRSAVVEVERVIETLQLSADAGMALVGEMLPMGASPRGAGKLGFTLRVPVGVIAAITPFNSPLNLAAHKLGPALAAGNTIVLKPHPQTPSCNVILVETLMEAGLPDGVVNLVLGDGRTGDRLVRNDDVSIVSFTGGGGNANFVRAAAGSKKLLMELGGNNATIVHADADVEHAASECVANAFGYQGQSCIGVQRVFVDRVIHDTFLSAVVQRTRALRVGDPDDEQTQIGPMIDEASAVRVETWLSEAATKGAKVLCGGERRGTVVTPAVVCGAPPSSRIACEEVFGPVMLVDPFDAPDEAIARANSSRYGLQAGVFTRSIGLMMHAVRELEVGGVVINGTSNTRVDLQPYGGVKQSGAGREGPAFAIKEMTEVKTILINDTLAKP